MPSGPWGVQNLANTAWAFAKMPIVHVPLMHALSAASIPLIEDFKPLELPITFWAFATLHCADLPLLHAISEAAIRKSPEFSMLDLSNTAWALALLGRPDVPLLEAIAASASRQLQAGHMDMPLGNPWTMLWSMWRLHQSELGQGLFERFSSYGLMAELVCCSVALMDNAWRRLDPVEVHIDEAMQEVCFWSLPGSGNDCTSDLACRTTT